MMSQDDLDSIVPPATFEFMVSSLRMQAEVQLGLLHFGDPKERPEPNFALARHAIDLIAMLQEKTKGNLSWPEQREIDNSLTELRFRYVQISNQAAANKKDAAEAGGETDQAGSPGTQE
jgi:hypothetical protein